MREREGETNVSHLMVEGDFAVRGRLVGGEDAADDLAPGGGAADVLQLLVPERVDDVVEVGSRGRGVEAAEQDGAVLVEDGLQPRLVLLDGCRQSYRRRRRRRQNGRERNPAVHLLKWGAHFSKEARILGSHFLEIINCGGGKSCEISCSIS